MGEYNENAKSFTRRWIFIDRPGHYFFYGIKDDWTHKHQCIRISYAQDDEDVRTGLKIIADVIRAC